MPTFTDHEEEELYTAVKRYLYDHYEPATNLPSSQRMSTQEIFNRLQEHMPGKYYTKTDVSHWMVEGGFTTFAIGDLRIEWILKKRAA